MNEEFIIENNELVEYIGSDTIVHVPEGVTKIRPRAFNRDVTDVFLPDGLKTIGTAAFTGCRTINSITIPNSVDFIGNTAFCWCSNLKSIVIPDGVTTIESHTFMGCISLKSVTLPNSLEGIETDAFIYCESLERITIPEKVTYISESAFEGCKSLKEVVILSYNIEFEKNAFKGIDSAATINAPYCMINQFESCNKRAAVMGYLSLLEEGVAIDDAIIESLKKYLKSQKVNYFQMAANWDILKKYMQLWGIMPTQESESKVSIKSVVDLYPRRTVGKAFATDLLIIASTFGDRNDVEYVIKKYGKSFFSDGGIQSAIYFAGAIADSRKLSIFANIWTDRVDTTFDALFLKPFNPERYWYDYHFCISGRALDFYHSQMHNDDEWPEITDITLTQRIECATELMKNGFLPSPDFLSRQYSTGNFDVYDKAHAFGIELNIEMFDYLYNPKAANPRTYCSYGFTFYQTLQRMEDQDQAKKRLEHLLALLDGAAIKPVITNNMIKNQIAEYLFSPELREFTLAHYDMSNITKASIKKLTNNMP